ncbi:MULTISPECIES: nucleotidyltransferase family protein [Larkinella]|uniref:Nucleotidyltransferase n=1 Tax=Larkinella humicola TaxID=2607654 RepID=A0A5N1JRA1_9BACT|nr:nucleotidyltransferase domain-containing protein [Larkinella humicola]KAA9356363.1 nucleotidyltransferase [Larkinella humicola]
MVTTVKSTLAEALQPYFSQQPVVRVYLFGSLARGEENEDSDIDLLVEFAKGATLFDQARISWQLEELLNHKVDVISESGVASTIRPFIDQDRILIYEK